MLVCAYENSDKLPTAFDLAYVDGPTSWSRTQENLDLPNVDVLRLRNRPNFVIIDGRRPTLKFLILNEAFDEFSISLSGQFAWLEDTIAHPGSYHTFLLESVLAPN